MTEKDYMLRVEGSSTLYRDESGAIVNTDTQAYLAYKKKRISSKKKEETIESLGSQLKEAQNEIEELKSLIKEFLNK